MSDTGRADAAPAAAAALSARNRVERIASWMLRLRHFLLTSRKLTREELSDFEALQREMFRDWWAVCQRDPTPKLHMILHTVDTVRETGSCGAYAESQMESAHHVFNEHWKKTVKCIPKEDRARDCLAYGLLELLDLALK